MALLKPFQLGIVGDILNSYTYDKPFHLHFQQLAKQHRNWGAKDRKTYRNACYAYFRLGRMTVDQPVEDMVNLGLEVQSGIRTLESFEPIFPFVDLVSDELNAGNWLESHLHQKPVYLVMRKGKESLCFDFLNENNISFQVYDDVILHLPADSKAEKLMENGWAWVMDRASAAAADRVELEPGQMLWDACSGAGGKALFISQKFNQKIQLVCSDRRFTILENLKSRFINLGLELPRVELADLNEPFHIPLKFDAILTDVPCTGSGTWGRSPENLRSFDPDSIEFMAKLQKTIVSNALRNLKPGGTLYYMTCSVFKAENENNVNHFIVNHHLTNVSIGYLNFGFTDSDTLFCAVLKKN